MNLEQFLLSFFVINSFGTNNNIPKDICKLILFYHIDVWLVFMKELTDIKYKSLYILFYRYKLISQHKVILKRKSDIVII
jgi:hypothetical protein